MLTQILYVVGSTWVGTAAKLGAQHTVFWLAAIVLFYIPLAITVIYLNRAMPLEGGLYQWAKLGFNEFVAFLVGWNLWLYIILFISSIGVGLATNIGYAFGAEWMRASKTFITVITCILAIGLVGVTARGLGVGKWIQNAGGVMQLLTFGALLLIPLAGTRYGYHPGVIAAPAISLFSLNVFGKIAMGGFSGFEYVAILAGECRNPARTIGLSVVIASPIIALMFILGTDSVLAFSRPQDVDLVGPIPQTLSLGFARMGIAGPIGALVILLLVGRQLGAATLAVAGAARLPMVAGWDHLLPGWFARVHPRYRTPVNSALFVGAMILVMGLAGITGVGHQEAYQLLENASDIFYALAYLVMFAIPIIGLKPPPPLWLRVAAASGFVVTLLHVVLSIFPIITVKSWFAFGAKISGVVILANLVGVALYLMGSRRAR